MKNFFKHLKMIRTHRKYVIKACFNMGIPLQGLLHDLSKYSLTELKIYKYYTGTSSPHDTARNKLGYSPSWYHHRNRNKHHPEYWIDSLEKMTAVTMPYRFVAEMVSDFIAAGKVYSKDKWSVKMPWEYWEKNCRGVRILNFETEYLFEKLLWNLHEAESEKAFYKQYKRIKKYLKTNYENGTLIKVESEINYE